MSGEAFDWPLDQSDGVRVSVAVGDLSSDRDPGSWGVRVVVPQARDLHQEEAWADQIANDVRTTVLKELAKLREGRS